ncbi:MAG: acyl carrier protein [Candidatus Cryptobacteroides sp.]
MTKKEIKEIVDNYIVEELEVDPECIFDEASLKEDIGIDSLDLVDIVVFVDKYFGFKIKVEDMAAVKTLAQFYDYIEANVKGR